MNLSPSDTLLLNSYLMLCRGALLFNPPDLYKTIAFQEVQWRDINIVVFPGVLTDLEEGVLESFIEKSLNDRFSPWLSWIFVGDIETLEELALYCNLLLGSVDSQDQALVSSLSLSYLADTVFWEAWPVLKDQLNAVLCLEGDGIPEGLVDRFEYLLRLNFNKIGLNDQKTIVEILYDDRLSQAESWKNLAVQSFQHQQWEMAVQYYQYALHCHSFIPSFWADFGSSLFKIQHYTAAKDALQKAIGMDLSNNVYYYTLGLVEEALGNTDRALSAYQQSIDLNPQNLDSYCALGNLLSTLEAWEAAEAVYQEGLEKSLWHFGLYLNLGNLFLKTDRSAQAIQAYKKALQLAPNNPEILHNLTIAYANQPSQHYFYQGKYLESQNQTEAAIAAYQRSLAIDSSDAAYFQSALRLCEIYQDQKSANLVRKTVESALDQISSTHSFDSSFLRPLLLYLNKQNESEISRDLSQKYAFFKTPEIQKLLEVINFPILYHHFDQLAIFRRALEQAIDAIVQLDIHNPLIQDELFNFFRSFVHAFINYQGENDRDIQTQCATIVESLLAARYPQWTTPLESKPGLPTSKIRIGYASYYLRRHNGARWALGWVQHHDREKFELYTYHFGEVLDGYTKAFCDASREFKHLAEADFETFEAWLREAVNTIRNDRLDLLIFPDLGMEPRTYVLSKLRLAPIQCTAWGHPVTSGSKYVDYYLSSHLMESEQSQNHYTEKLVRLPHLGLCYPTPQLPEPSQDRSFFQLPGDRILYLSCQSLFKYLPQYDFIYPAIAQQVPQAYFVFLETFLLGETFSQRLHQSFNKVGLSSTDYCQILPKQSWDNYIQLQYLADIYLDTIAWTGGNSTLEAVACGLPVVTYPGSSMRSRHSYAILQRLGLTETIAHSLEEYIEIAAELGRNPEWRKQLSSRYPQNAHRLFDDRRVTESLDRVFLSLTLKQSGI